jgi:DNA-binding LytR/AlgR family response regulator
MTKAIIADSDAYSARQTQSLLRDLWPELEVCATAESGLEALQLIDAHTPRIAFLEVRLPGLCGMQVARKITNTCYVVFITGHDHYAVNAFDSGALDYLLKPLNRRRLQKAILRVKRQLSISPEPSSQGRGLPAHPRTDRLSMKKQNFLQWICTQNGRRSKFISTDQVCYFKADHKYTSIITNDGEALINKSIKSLADELDPSCFWRIHRSTIVNVAKVTEVSRSKTGRGTVRLRDRSEVLTISRPYLHLFKNM